MALFLSIEISPYITKNNGSRFDSFESRLVMASRSDALFESANVARGKWYLIR